MLIYLNRQGVDPVWAHQPVLSKICRRTADKSGGYMSYSHWKFPLWAVQIVGWLLVVFSFYMGRNWVYPTLGQAIFATTTLGLGVLCIVVTAGLANRSWTHREFRRNFGVGCEPDADFQLAQAMVNEVLWRRAGALALAYQEEEHLRALARDHAVRLSAVEINDLQGCLRSLQGHIETTRVKFYSARDIAVSAGFLAFESWQDYGNSIVRGRLLDPRGKKRYDPQRLITHKAAELDPANL